jgi:hypothetical protein
MKNEIDNMVTSLAEDLKPLVELVENSTVVTTQNHYEMYLQFMTTFCVDAKDPMLRIFSSALVEAGANAQGVESALRMF